MGVLPSKLWGGEGGRSQLPQMHPQGQSGPLIAKVAETQLTTQESLGMVLFLSMSDFGSVHPLCSPDPRHPSYKKKGSCWRLAEPCPDLCPQRGTAPSLHTEAPSSSMYPSSFPSETSASQDLHIKSCDGPCNSSFFPHLLPPCPMQRPLESPHPQPLFFLPCQSFYSDGTTEGWILLASSAPILALQPHCPGPWSRSQSPHHMG